MSTKFMMPEHWQQLSRLYHEARQIALDTERAAFIDAACAGDKVLADEVSSLLKSDAATEAGRTPEGPDADRFRSALETRLPLSRIGPVDSDERFAPGRIFADRYRVVSLLGRGATGEVYRADDLKLGQRVALKLLAPTSGQHRRFLERFIAEVRLARDIAHPNVCRVYDIGEAEGWHYLSMEYIDGETLSSLLRRIGSLPAEKALDVARQLGAGLAAAHDRGVLHRDLKPGNIMLDGRGQVRIVDLGFATPIADPKSDVAGTPAYMAPEQLRGDYASERSDLFALGAVLYELFTGQRLFRARTFAERLISADGGPPAVARLAGIDPAVENVIRSCLEVDPADRPASAWAVAARLPGGDPLAAALAAGRMPSPEMIAAAGQRGALRPVTAWTLLAAVVFGTLGVAFGVHRLAQIDPSRVPKPPEVLAERARTVLASAGHAAPVRDTEYWFEPDIRFVYRESSNFLVSQNSMHVVMEGDPPNDVPGLATVVLDPTGRLVRLVTVLDTPGQTPDVQHSGNRAPVKWAALFAEAGLDSSSFAPISAAAAPPLAHDTRVAWDDRGGEAGTLRVAGASLDGRAVYFDVSTAGALPVSRQTWFSRGARSPTNEVLLAMFSLALFIGGGIIARRNLRLGYGDTRGGRRLAIFIACGGVLRSEERRV